MLDRRWRAAALAIAGVCSAGTVLALPSFDTVRAQHQPSDVTVVDRHGVPLQTLRVDATVRRLSWVSLADVSPALLQAIVLSEDRRFYEHSGVDWTAVAQSAWANLWNSRTRGASTLTMQLAGLMDEDLARPSGGRSVGQKLGQAVVATRLEARWKKSEILEAYLNRVAFRGELVGIGALSQTLFGKWPSGLDAHESAITAALLRGPNAAPDVVAQRACGVLTRQQQPCTGVVSLTHQALSRRGDMPLGEQLAPHVARQVVNGREAVQASTLDARVQRLAIDTLRRHLAELRGRNVEDGAVLVLDNHSGEVLAWVGSSGRQSSAAAVDAVLARRQPGSTLKPFVYGLAFERRLLTPATLLDDSPAQLATTDGIYQPRNYDHQFRGWVSVRTALGASLNVPAVKAGAMLGPDALVERLNALGLALPKAGGYYGHALALGGAEVSLLGLTNAYRTLANGGSHGEVIWRRDATAVAPATRRVLDAGASFLVGDILADNVARVHTFGLDSPLVTPGFAAVKTGTSKDMRDNWCVGYTDRFTVGVWVGNASGSPMHDVSGVHGAAPVWQALVRALHEGRPSRTPSPPQGVERHPVSWTDARGAPSPEADRDEYFLPGTAQARWTASSQVTGAQRFGITSPREGTVFALDPDIPPHAQRIVMAGQWGTWVLNGQRLGRGTQISWAPSPGRHQLALLGANGQPLHSVRFEVRGATLKPRRGVTGGAPLSAQAVPAHASAGTPLRSTAPTPH